MIVSIIFTAICSLSVIMTGSGAFLCWRRRKSPGAMELCGMMISVAWWSLANLLEFHDHNYAGRIWLSRLAYFGILGTSSCYLLFALCDDRRRTANWSAA